MYKATIWGNERMFSRTANTVKEAVTAAWRESIKEHVEDAILQTLQPDDLAVTDQDDETFSQTRPLPDHMDEIPLVVVDFGRAVSAIGFVVRVHRGKRDEKSDKVITIHRSADDVFLDVSLTSVPISEDYVLVRCLNGDSIVFAANLEVVKANEDLNGQLLEALFNAGIIKTDDTGKYLI